MGILLNLNYLSEIIPLFFCVLFFKKNSSKEIKVFLVYKIIVVLLLILSITADKKYTYNIDASISVVMEFILLSIMYSYIIKSALFKKIIASSIFVFAIYWIYTFSKITNTEFTFDFLTVVIESFFFTIVIVYYFYEIMRYNFTTPLFKLPNFWISVAFLIYFSGSFFLVLYSKSMFGKPTWTDQYLIIICTITIIKNILLCIALFVNKNLIAHKDNNLIPSNLNLDPFQPLNKQTNY